MAPRMGRRLGRACVFWVIVVVGMASGCMEQPLRLATRRTAKTLPDLQYQQVIDNLATIASNPGFLPYLAIAGAGTIQVTDNRNSSLGLSLTPKELSSQILSFGSSRTVTGTWSLGTITSPEKIRSMRTVYQHAVRGSVQGDPACDWLKIGCRRDVPKQACYIGSHGHVFVWIMPEGIGGLSELTLAIMDVATREDAVIVPVGVKEVVPPVAGSRAVPRRNFQIHPLGPVYTPGLNRE
jgi:hypothetical protein